MRRGRTRRRRPEQEESFVVGRPPRDEREIQLEVVERNALSARVRPIDVVAEGGFGCILKGYQEHQGGGGGTWGFEMGVNDSQRQRAIKIQAITERTLEEVARKEALVNRQVSRVVEDRQAPGVTQFFDAFISKEVPAEWIDLLGQTCPNFNRKHLKLETVTVQRRGKRVATRKTKSDLFLYTVTEFADSGNLQEYVESRVKTNLPFHARELSNLAFQVCWSLFVLQGRFGFRHFDIKMANIVLKRVTESRMYHFQSRGDGYDGDDTWIYGIGGDGVGAAYRDLMSFPFEVKLVDFGFGELLRTPLLELSGSDDMSNLRGTIDIFEPEVFFDLPSVGRRGFDADVWAVGLLLLELGVAGWRRPPEITHARWRTGASLDVTRLRIFSLYKELGTRGEVEERRSNAQRVRDNIVAAVKRDPKYNRADHRYLAAVQEELFDVLFGICLFQHAAGHGLLPSLEEWPELRGNAVYAGLDVSRRLLLSMGTVRYVSRCSTTTRRTRRRSTTRELYALVLERALSRYGAEGLDLVVRMLSWTRRGRQTLGGSGPPGLFHNCITHRFFQAHRASAMTPEVERVIAQANKNSSRTCFRGLKPTTTPSFRYRRFTEQDAAKVWPSEEVLYESPWTYLGPLSPMSPAGAFGTTTTEAYASMTYSTTVEPSEGTIDVVDLTFTDTEDEVEERVSQFIDVVQTDSSVIFLGSYDRQLSPVGGQITAQRSSRSVLAIDACDYSTPAYVPAKR